MEIYPRFDYDLRAPLARGERAYPWYWGGMPKGVFGTRADNNTPHKRVYVEACGGPTPWSSLPAEELRRVELGLVLWSSNRPSASWFRNIVEFGPILRSSGIG